MPYADTSHRWRTISFIAVTLIAAVVFVLGIGWGLPSRVVDPYLFGNIKPWSGKQIAALAPKESDERGADVDANPIDRSHAVVLNATDAQRAEIIRRYRLFSNQPDEMITLKSLSRIAANHGDPRLYQYGGLWIYPVGAMLKAGAILGMIDLRSDPAYYLDHPEAFGRFYIVARLYCALWGIAGALAVCVIIRRLGGDAPLCAIAGVCFVLMPVVMNAAHEAKPHLPGASLILLTILFADQYLRTARRRWAMITGIFCGAATGMVASGVVAFAVLIVMAIASVEPVRHRLASIICAAIAGIVIYAITNPFVLINAIAHPQLLHSNVANTTAMYPATASGFLNAMHLIAIGASPLLAIVGLGAIVYLFIKRFRRSRHAIASATIGRSGYVLPLLVAPAIATLIPYVLFATHKPPEYARFALIVDIALLITSFALMARVHCPIRRLSAALVLLIATACFGLPYLAGFMRDARPMTSRLIAATELRQRLRTSRDATLILDAEPAPYDCPPVNLFQTRLLLPPPGDASHRGLRIIVDESRSSHPISWADVRFSISSSP